MTNKKLINAGLCLLTIVITLLSPYSIGDKIFTTVLLILLVITYAASDKYPRKHPVQDTFIAIQIVLAVTVIFHYLVFMPLEQ